MSQPSSQLVFIPENPSNNLNFYLNLIDFQTPFSLRFFIQNSYSPFCDLTPSQRNMEILFRNNKLH